MVCDRENRLGVRGADEIRSHPFFAGVDFTGLRRIRAPFEPSLASDFDTSHFPVDEIPQDDHVDAMTGVITNGPSPDEALNPEMSLPFIGYTFKRFEKSFN